MLCPPRIHQRLGTQHVRNAEVPLAEVGFVQLGADAVIDASGGRERERRERSGGLSYLSTNERESDSHNGY